MDSTSCVYAEKDGKTITGEIIGTDSAHKNTQEVLCQEYVLQSDRMIYLLRPKDTKHPILLPVGESVDFRFTRTCCCSATWRATRKSASTSSYRFNRDRT